MLELNAVLFLVALLDVPVPGLQPGIAVFVNLLGLVVLFLIVRANPLLTR